MEGQAIKSITINKIVVIKESLSLKAIKINLLQGKSINLLLILNQ